MKPSSNLEEFLSIIDALMEKLLGVESLGWTPAGECNPYLINFFVLVVTSFFVMFFVETKVKLIQKKHWLLFGLAAIGFIAFIYVNYEYDINKASLIGKIHNNSPKQAEAHERIVFPQKKEIDLMSAEDVKDVIGRSVKYRQESISSCMMLKILSTFRLFFVATATLFCWSGFRQLYPRKEHPHSESESVGRTESTKDTKSTKNCTTLILNCFDRVLRAFRVRPF